MAQPEIYFIELPDFEGYFCDMDAEFLDIVNENFWDLI